MAANALAETARTESGTLNSYTNGSDDPFTEPDQSPQQPYYHRFSSRFEPDTMDLSAASSPSQAKRVLEAHLQDTERRLQDTHKLGTSLLQQQSELQDKLREVEQQQDESEISPELRQRLVSIGKEHDDVSREIARSLLAPKSRAVSGEEHAAAESAFLTSQATGSPTKMTAPNRRSRNQPTNRAGDLQFYADISTSFLAQVRQLQGIVAERDEALKSVNAERSKLEQDAQLYAQRLRTYDENEQKYKDENWNLQAQTHELLSAQREAVDREKRLNGTIAVANAERARLLNEVEDFRLAHSKVVDEHNANKKAHETEMHSLKRDFDGADLDRSSLQTKIDELTSQNRELAKAMASQYRNQSPQRQLQFDDDAGDASRDFSTPEQSPPPSPTKQTPRHGGLESETLKSSLHHAHRMIQNLKGNIHREKTEKIELKRMLQDARDELEQRRGDNSFSNGSKKQKSRNEPLKKPTRPDMLGNSRRAVTDVEVEDDEWEDHANGDATRAGLNGYASTSAQNELSDAYQTAHETESNFETADERMTESEAFMTGAESLAGDSTDDLTETESTTPQFRNRSSIRHNRQSLAARTPGARDSYLSTASTSAGEEEDQTQTPILSQPHRFKLRTGRSSSSRQTQIYDGTPDSVRTQGTTYDSPATTIEGRSPPGVEQSLFTELEQIYDTSSNYSTPARPNTATVESTPGALDTPSRSVHSAAPEPVAVTKPVMVDSSMMTDPWHPEPSSRPTTFVESPGLLAAHSPATLASGGDSRVVSIGDFPLPPSSPPVHRIDTGTQYTPPRPDRADVETTPQQVYDASVQYTPSRTIQESPVRAPNTFITPPKTVWDPEHESEMGTSNRNSTAVTDRSRFSLSYSGLLAQDTTPVLPAEPVAEPQTPLAYSSIISQQTYPFAPPLSQPPSAPLPPVPSVTKREKAGSDRAIAGAASGGILAGAAAVFGLSRPKDSNAPTNVAEDSTSGPAEPFSPAQEPSLKNITGNATLRRKTPSNDSTLRRGAPVMVSHNDQGSQTAITSEEIDRALRIWQTDKKVPAKSLTILEPATATSQKALARSPDMREVVVPSSSSAPTSPPLRPSSASGWRPSSVNKQHPPLPSDYRTNIARANSQLQDNMSRKDSVTPVVGGVMGPPSMPASAMRRPKTPSGSVRSPSRENATPRGTRASRIRGNGGADSQLSRRSSVSSFASEIDERFNIRAGAAGNGYDALPGTDPRMIQAITQTMIGEYLWKYTRKTGSKEMSTTRHKRYFWVHPYTKTLYWSTADPSLPGSKESTSRSVPIESIRVVTDDNPMPPGLHRKSLEITTPGRKVKFTATTGQRHETWFNALSYLLLRGEQSTTLEAYVAGGNEITRDDIDEFRADGQEARLAAPSRTSMSSYNSRTTTGTSKRVSGATGGVQRQALPSHVVSNGLRHQNSVTQNSSILAVTTDSGRVSRTDSVRGVDKDRTIRASSVSRVSRMLGSITGRHSRQSVVDSGELQQASQVRGPSRSSNSIYDASVVSTGRDSAEEMRQEMLQQEAAGLGSGGGLENVRACCDGKHDVSTLHHDHPQDRHGALSSMSERINRSMSKRV